MAATVLFEESDSHGEILAPATSFRPPQLLAITNAPEPSNFITTIWPLMADPGAEGDGNTAHDDFWEMYCSVITPETLRMALVAVVGSAVAGISLIFNAFLFYVLVRKRQNRKTHLLYLTFMAFIDVFLSASYILLFPVNLFMDFYESDFLSGIWWNLLRPMYALCHIAITASALLLTAATFERYLTISKIRTRFPTSFRLAISSAALFFALAAKGPMFFELKVDANANCTGVTAFVPRIEAWTEAEPYKTVYKFLFRSVVSTFLPFFLSFYFNFRIVVRLNRQHAAARLFRFATSEHRKNIRSATRMLVLVACCYIACNFLNVLVTAWEMMDMEMLMSEHFRPYYTYSTDLVSLLTVFACGVRLPIYYACNARIRREVNKRLFLSLRLFSCFLSASGEKINTHKFSRDNASLATMRYLNTGNGFIVYSNASSGSPSSSYHSSGSRKSKSKSPKTKRNNNNSINNKNGSVKSAHANGAPTGATTEPQPSHEEEEFPEAKLVVVGTGFDKVVLQLAIRSWRTNSRR